MAGKIELGIGLEVERPQQVRFELVGDSQGILLAARHEDGARQWLARFRVEHDGKLSCELRKLFDPALCAAFGVFAGCVIPITIEGDPDAKPLPIVRDEDEFEHEALEAAAVQLRADAEGWQKAADRCEHGGLQQHLAASARIRREIADRLHQIDRNRSATTFGEFLPPDVQRLVVAAREVVLGNIADLVEAHGDADAETALRDLDQASEALESRVRWPAWGAPPEIALPGHAWRYLAAMCRRERERLAGMNDEPGDMLPMTAAWESLGEIETMIPLVHWAAAARAVGAKIDEKADPNSPTAQLMVLAGPTARIVQHAVKSWASITFKGSRETIDLEFTGDGWREAWEELQGLLPVHKWNTSGPFIADAAIMEAVPHEDRGTIKVQLIMVESD